VLHNHATLEPQDAELAGRLNLPVYTHETGREVFALPCPCYKDDRCSVYPDRPTVCGAYQCRVLDRHLQGALSQEEAMGLAKQGRDLIAALYRHMDEAPDRSRSVWEQAEAFQARRRAAMEPAEFVRTHGEFLKNMTRLVGLVRREFLPSTRQEEPATLASGMARPAP
jgi:Fe-S-cluster containining protein